MTFSEGGQFEGGRVRKGGGRRGAVGAGVGGGAALVIALLYMVQLLRAGGTIARRSESRPIEKRAGSVTGVL